MIRTEGGDGVSDALDQWAFNVALECSGTQPSEGKIAIGGAVLSIHDLNEVLQAGVMMRDAVQNAEAFLDRPIPRRRYEGDQFYSDVVASLRATSAALKATPPQGDAT